MTTNQDVHVLMYELFDFYTTNLIQHINQIVTTNQQACIKLRKDLRNILLLYKEEWWLVHVYGPHHVFSKFFNLYCSTNVKIQQKVHPRARSIFIISSNLRVQWRSAKGMFHIYDAK